VDLSVGAVARGSGTRVTRQTVELLTAWQSETCRPSLKLVQ
jgi:hypothetical protein